MRISSKIYLSILFQLFFSQISFGQVCINNPIIQQGNMSSNSGSGTLSFSFVEQLLDYTDDENNPISITVCLSNMVPRTGTVDDATNYFTWTYNSSTNCFLGTQTSDIPGGIGGLISIDYNISYSACTTSNFSFNASLQPAACMNMINETVDDTVYVSSIGMGSGLTTTSPDCLAILGTASISGTVPLNVLWSTGETTQSISGLQSGLYSVTVTDTNNNCPVVESFQMIPNNTLCTTEILGNVSIDHIIPDCTIDSTSYPGFGRLVSLYKNNFLVDTTSTNSFGNYSFLVDTGTYEVIIEPDVYDLYNCGMSNQKTVLVNSFSNVYADFIFNTVGYQNLSISHAIARQGNRLRHDIIYWNFGTMPMNGNVEFVHDLRTHDLYTTNQNTPPNSYDTLTGTAIWDFNNLPSNQNGQITFYVTIMEPPIVEIGDTLSFKSSISPFANDIDTLDNRSNPIHVVLTSTLGLVDEAELLGSSRLFPNPSRGETLLEFDLLKKDQLTIELIGIKGEVIKSFTSLQVFEKGPHHYPIKAHDFPSGMYLVRISGKHETKVLKWVNY